MTDNDLAALAETEGWEYVLTEVRPFQLLDAGLAEALSDAQEAFKILVKATPECDFDFAKEDDELDFG